MKRQRFNFFPSLCIAGMMLFAFSVSAETRIWKSQDGKEVEGDLVSFDGNEVRLLINGEIFRFDPAVLSSEDQDFLAKWFRLSQYRDNRNLVLSASSRRGPVLRTEHVGYTENKREGYYQISLQNRMNQPIENVTIRYRLFIRDTDPGVSTSDGRGERVFDGQFLIKSLPANHTFEQDTESGTLREVRLQPGWVWTSGAPPRSRDVLRGLYYQVVIEDEVVQAFSNPGNLSEEMERERHPFFFPRRRPLP